MHQVRDWYSGVAIKMGRRYTSHGLGALVYPSMCSTLVSVLGPTKGTIRSARLDPLRRAGAGGQER